MELIAVYKLFTNLIFNWGVGPLDGVPASFVPFEREPQVCAVLSSKTTERIFELLRFQMSLQFRSKQKIGIMHAGWHLFQYHFCCY